MTSVTVLSSQTVGMLEKLLQACKDARTVYQKSTLSKFQHSRRPDRCIMRLSCLIVMANKCQLSRTASFYPRLPYSVTSCSECDVPSLWFVKVLIDRYKSLKLMVWLTAHMEDVRSTWQHTVSSSAHFSTWWQFELSFNLLLKSFFFFVKSSLVWYFKFLV